jgi:hypothetical protein
MYGLGGRPEYSALARFGDWVWARIIDPILLVVLGKDETTSLMRVRAAIQVTVLAASVLLVVALFFRSGRTINASGLLFDIAGAARIFLLEEIDHALSEYQPNPYGNYPSPAMREFIMPEGTAQRSINDNRVSFFYYKKRGVLFLFFGFVLQMISDFVG